MEASLWSCCEQSCDPLGHSSPSQVKAASGYYDKIPERKLEGGMICLDPQFLRFQSVVLERSQVKQSSSPQGKQEAGRQCLCWQAVSSYPMGLHGTISLVNPPGSTDKPRGSVDLDAWSSSADNKINCATCFWNVFT